MTEHHEDRDRVSEPGREMTEGEAKFYGGKAGDREVPETDRVAEPDRPSGKAAGSYDASAAAPARAPAERIEPAHRDERIATEGRSDRGAPGERDGVGEATATAGEREGATAAPLFPPEEADSLRGRWDAIQTEFVDEPRHAVEKADALVGDVMHRLANGFSHERSRLEKEWDRGDEVSTEDLRVALKRYRSFFDRLLSV